MSGCFSLIQSSSRRQTEPALVLCEERREAVSRPGRIRSGNRRTATPAVGDELIVFLQDLVAVPGEDRRKAHDTPIFTTEKTVSAGAALRTRPHFGDTQLTAPLEVTSAADSDYSSPTNAALVRLVFVRDEVGIFVSDRGQVRHLPAHWSPPLSGLSPNTWTTVAHRLVSRVGIRELIAGSCTFREARSGITARAPVSDVVLVAQRPAEVLRNVRPTVSAVG